MENWCRLCAIEKYPFELIYNIDDEFTNIKQKLIDCCRWNEIADADQYGVPKKICKYCYENLERCWSFAESVSLAQQKIQMHAMNVKPTALSEVEQLNASLNAEDQCAVKSEVPEYTVSVSPLASLDFDYDDSMCQSPIEDNEFIDEKDVKVSLTEETATTEISDCDLMAVLSDADKNADGTIKPQKIVDLNLADWTIVKLSCSICKKLFGKQSSLQSHFRLKHPKEKLQYYCTLCDLTTGKLNALKDHMVKIHRPYLKFCCEKCNVFYWDMKKLKKHMSGRHPNQPKASSSKLKPDPSMPIDSLCAICGMHFTSQSKLKYHVRTHMPIEKRKSFECYLCRANFVYKKNLKLHIALHLGPKPKFQCDVCQLHFCRTDALRRHQFIHLNKLPHQCPYCSKGFRTRFNLRVHERTHTGEQPYECRYCSFRTAYGPNLVNHTKQKHQNKIDQPNNVNDAMTNATLTTMPFLT